MFLEKWNVMRNELCKIVTNGISQDIHIECRNARCVRDGEVPYVIGKWLLHHVFDYELS